MRIHRLSTSLRGAAYGLAIGALLATWGCAAFGTQGLHLGLRVVDWAVGVLLASLPMLVTFIVLRVSSTLTAWILRFLARHTPARVSRVLAWPLPLLRLIGHPLFATTLTIVWLVWFSPNDGPLALYHSMFFFEILVAAGALSGLLFGIGFSVAELSLSPRAGRALTMLTIIPALVVMVGVAAWAAYPGLGAAATEEPAAATITQLDLPDPSQPGQYSVELATYGSGTDARRPEYGAAADWITPTVDASKALPTRAFPDEAYARWFWGFDDTALPINALVWYPTDAPGRLPVALIVHGNHDAGDYSDPGYAYLGAHLASHGIITASIDENFLNGDSFYDYAGAEMGTRAWFLLRHLEQFRTWDATAGNPLYGRVDLGRVALMGHSRGGEAATLAAVLNGNPAIRINGLPDVPRDFGIRAVVAIAPSDTMYRGPGAPTRLQNLDYLLIEGARDGDLPGYDGLAAYHRVNVGDSGGHLKVAAYSARANHGRFNTVWDYGDAGPLSSWLLDRGAILAPAGQEHLAKTVIGAFLYRSLLGQTGYDAFFREPRSGRAWLPDDLLQTHWQSSNRVTVDDFARFDTERIAAQGFAGTKTADVPLRDGAAQGDRAALLTWANGASLTIPIAAAPADPRASLVFAMVATLDSTTAADPTIVLHSADGADASVRLSEVAPARPLIPVQLWKLPGLGDRYASDERHRWPAERFLQTYDLPLDAFIAAAPTLDVTRLDSVTFRFDGEGSVYLDDVAFEPPVGAASASLEEAPNDREGQPGDDGLAPDPAPAAWIIRSGDDRLGGGS